MLTRRIFMRLRMGEGESVPSLLFLPPQVQSLISRTFKHMFTLSIVS
jgi:hypothetical protein